MLWFFNSCFPIWSWRWRISHYGWRKQTIPVWACVSSWDFLLCAFRQLTLGFKISCTNSYSAGKWRGWRSLCRTPGSHCAVLTLELLWPPRSFTPWLPSLSLPEATKLNLGSTPKSVRLVWLTWSQENLFICLFIIAHHIVFETSIVSRIFDYSFLLSSLFHPSTVWNYNMVPTHGWSGRSYRFLTLHV